MVFALLAQLDLHYLPISSPRALVASAGAIELQLQEVNRKLNILYEHLQRGFTIQQDVITCAVRQLATLWPAARRSFSCTSGAFCCTSRPLHSVL